MKLTTTTKQFRDDGVALSGKPGDEVRWESTGHLCVRLLDQHGQVPLANRRGRVQLPEEGTVELLADVDGWMRHPDVPFLDYEIELGEGLSVHAPAVASLDDGHQRPVPGAKFGFLRVALCDAAGAPLANATIEVEPPEGSIESWDTNERGEISDPTPRPAGRYQLRGPGGRAALELPSVASLLAIVQLAEAS